MELWEKIRQIKETQALFRKTQIQNERLAYPTKPFWGKSIENMDIFIIIIIIIIIITCN